MESDLASTLRGIDTALDEIDTGKSRLTTALDRLDDAGGPDALGALLSSHDDQAQHALTCATDAAERIVKTQQALTSITKILTTYRQSLAGSTALPPEPERAPPPPRSTAPAAPPAYTNSHGDRYPAEGAGLAAGLPPRVVHGNNDATVGMLRINGRPPPELVSRGSSAFVKEGAQLLRAIGITDDDHVAKLSHHVEIRAMALLSQFPDVSHAEIAINNTPCGVETRLPNGYAGCIELLPEIAAYTSTSLTVYGTYQDNRTYHRSFEGSPHDHHRA